MEIVIELPDCIKNDLDKAQNDRDAVALVVQCSIPIAKAIINGTPLPKGHGDIVDLDQMCYDYWDGNYMEIHKDDLPNIPVIIKADKGEEE